jgi:hypothetical protein
MTEPTYPEVWAEEGDKSPKINLQSTFLSDYNLDNAELPPREMILYPWLHAKSYNLITGFRGAGKTWFGLSLFHAITYGENFGPWKTVNPVNALYLESEMSIEDIRDRIHAIGTNEDAHKEFLIYSDDYTLTEAKRFVNGKTIKRANLLDKEWRDNLTEILKEWNIKLIGLDNLASLSPGRNENSKDEFDPINQWLIHLRFEGISSVVFHHTGKAGDQRGTSAHEDNVDISISFNKPHDYRTSDGCRFISHFGKRRSVPTEGLPLTEDYDLQMQINNGKVQWTFNPLEKKNKSDVIQLAKDGYKQINIAETLKIDPATVSRILREARESGKLPPKKQKSC